MMMEFCEGDKLVPFLQKNPMRAGPVLQAIMDAWGQVSPVARSLCVAP